MNQKSNFWPVALAMVAVVIAIGAAVSNYQAVTSLEQVVSSLTGEVPGLGASTPGSRFPHGITVGLPTYSPANLALISAGTCSLVSDTSIAATSTGTGTCSTPGALAGDIVVVDLSTTTTKMAAQYAVTGTVASTDSTTVRLLNLTGTAAVPSATSGLGSSTQYAIYRVQ